MVKRLVFMSVFGRAILPTLKEEKTSQEKECVLESVKRITPEITQQSNVVDINFTSSDIKVLSEMTLAQLVQDLDYSLKVGIVTETCSVADYTKNYLIPKVAEKVTEKVTEKVDEKVAEVVVPKRWFIVDQYNDKEMEDYATTTIIKADSIETIKLTSGPLYFEAEEDVELVKPAIFSTGILNNNKVSVKTIYVQATSYREALSKLTVKLTGFMGNNRDYSLGVLYKDKKSPFDLLLSNWKL